jgi:transcriptional regulator with XRE-family HTH domain
MDSTSSNLAANLKRLREVRGLSQQGLADLSGVPRPTVAHLESGNANPTVVVLLRVCQVLGVPLDRLIEQPGAHARFYPQASLPRRSRAGVTVTQLLVDPPPGLGIERLELTGKAAHTASGQSGSCRYLACEAGELEVAFEGKSFRLGAGDVLSMRGGAPYECQRTGRRAAIAYQLTVPMPG